MKLSKKFKYGSISNLIIIGFISIVVILNVILNILVTKFPLKIDLTVNQEYEFSEESKKFLSTLNDDIKIIVLRENAAVVTSEINSIISYNSSQYGTQGGTISNTYFEELFNDYSRYSSKVSVSYVDINKNPTFLSANKINQTEMPENPIIIVQSAKTMKYKVITADNLYATVSSTDYYSPPSFKNIAEGSITGAIQFAVTVNENVAYLLEGHGEFYGFEIKQKLIDLGYDVETINLTTATNFLPNSKVIISSSPVTDFSNAEIEKIEGFINNNGEFGNSFMFFVSSKTPTLPNIEKFLSKKWGITVEPYRVIDNTFASSGFMQLDYGDEALAKGLVSKKIPSVVAMYSPKLLTLDKTVAPNVSSLYKTTDKSFTKEIASTSNEKLSTDKSGVFDVAAMSYKNKTSLDFGEAVNRSYVFVCSTTSLIDDAILSVQNYGNSIYFESIIYNITGISGKNYVYVPSKSIETSALNFTSDLQIIFIAIGFVIVLPILIIGYGLLVWRKRRHL